jgi:hypothetical protein
MKLLSILVASAVPVACSGSGGGERGRRTHRLRRSSGESNGPPRWNMIPAHRHALVLLCVACLASLACGGHFSLTQDQLAVDSQCCLFPPFGPDDPLAGCSESENNWNPCCNYDSDCTALGYKVCTGGEQHQPDGSSLYGVCH